MVAEADMTPGKLLPYRSPKTANEWTARLGMTIFLASWAMLFAALFFIYAGMRFRAPVWPSPELPPLPLGQGAINTVAIAASSATYIWAMRRLVAGQPRGLRIGMVLTIGMGLLFMLLQWQVWGELLSEGLTVGSGLGSIFYGLTWVHAAHVAVGLLGLGYVTVRAFLGTYTAANYLTLRLWAMYWHFVGIVWGLLFLTVYVL